MAVTPPSIRKSAPTTNAESSDARYTASFAISNGSAIRLLGLLVRRTSLTASPCSSPGKRPNIAVSVGPGLRVFTRIPRSTSSALRIRARCTTAALQVETVEVVGHPLRAPTDALMITDEPCLSSGKAYQSDFLLARSPRKHLIRHLGRSRIFPSRYNPVKCIRG